MGSFQSRYDRFSGRHSQPKKNKRRIPAQFSFEFGIVYAEMLGRFEKGSKRGGQWYCSILLDMPLCREKGSVNGIDTFLRERVSVTPRAFEEQSAFCIGVIAELL